MGTLKTCAPYVGMVVIEFACAGLAILMKMSLNSGMSQLVYIVYRHLIAMLLIGPFAYFLEKMEKLRIDSAKGRAKVYGTLVCIGGALTFTFWKGGYYFKGFTRKPLIDIEATRVGVHGSRHHKEDWVKGSLLILTSYIASSAWLILQALISNVYPAPLSMNTLVCFFASLQCSVLALIFDRELTSWRLEWDVQLLTIIYSGVVSSAFVYCLQTWCISEKGPVFAAMFSPLVLVIVGLFSAIVFSERLHLGSLIGAFFTVVGLYIVLWGKSTDSCSEDSVGKDERFLDHQIQEVSTANQPLSRNIPTTTGKN